MEKISFYFQNRTFSTEEETIWQSVNKDRIFVFACTVPLRIHDANMHFKQPKTPPSSHLVIVINIIIKLKEDFSIQSTPKYVSGRNYSLIRNPLR